MLLTTNQLNNLKVKRYKSNRPKIGRRWRKNWSSRGIAMLNGVESYTPSSDNTIIVGEPSFREKLNRLIERYPQNRFFKSLWRQLTKTKRLSFKQRNAIDKSYFSLATSEVPGDTDN